MTKAVIYARYSSDNQRDASIDAQVRACREYARKNDLDIIHVYADRAMTGTTDRRPEFQSMIKAAKRGGGFEVVLVHKLDRFSRDRLEAMLYKRELAIHSVRLESTLERLGDDPESALMESIYFGMAEFYSRNLAREVKKGMNENALKGLHCGGMAPFGFQLNKTTRKLEINPDEAGGVRMAFELYLSGCSYEEIAQRLNDAGFHTRTGGSFTKGSLHGMLINEKYCGRWYYGKIAPKDARKKRNHHAFNNSYTVIPGGCPAIVSEATFNAAQERLQKRKRGKRMEAKTTWLLSGLVVCGCCGELMHTQPRTARGERYYYYQCKTKGCLCKSIPKDVLEGEVLRQIDANIGDSSRRELAARMIESINAKADAKSTEKEIAQIAQKLDNLSKALAEGAPWAALAPQWNELTSRKEELQAQKLEEAGANSYDLRDAIEFLGRFGGLQSMSPDQQREILQRNVRKITLTRLESESNTWDMAIMLYPENANAPQAEPVGLSMVHPTLCHLKPRTTTCVNGALLILSRIMR